MSSIPSSPLSNAPVFPQVVWGDMEATYLPIDTPKPEEVPIVAGLVFAMQEGDFLLADIEDRGWCILGGHLEEGETLEEAVRREAMEEAGAIVGRLHALGTYLFYYPATQKRVCVPTFWSEVLETHPLAPGSESRGTARVSWAEIPERYFYWDSLMQAVFDYALHHYHQTTAEDANQKEIPLP